LEQLLGVPVVATCALSGEGISQVVSRLGEARPGNVPHDAGSRWARVGHIVEQVQRVTHRHHTFLDRLADLSLNPATGIPLALIMALVCFSLIRFIGEGIITYLLDPAFNAWWLPLMTRLSGSLGPGGFWHELLIGNLVNGRINFKESMGLLTTGLYIPLAQVYPYVFAFYVVLSLVEDFGYLPRLGVLVDTIMHRLGLHGLTIIPTLLGLGCGVPGALATRILESRRQRFISAVLIAICVPCMAQTAMVIGLLGKYGFSGLGIVFGTLALLWLVLALAFKRFLPGEAPEIFTEIPPYRMPYPKAVAQKVWLRGRQFLADALPFVVLGVLAVNLLNMLHVIDFLKTLLAPALTTVLGLPPEAVTALLIGFLRKDVAVGMLAPLGLNFKQLVIASVVLTTFFPCAASFVVLLKEFGGRDMLKAAALMVFVSFATGGLLNLIL